MARILVVDDEISCRGPLARLLQLEGFDTTTAGDGAEALSSVKQSAPDLVVLDLIMPKMDGVGFLEAIRKESQYDSLPVLVVTGVHDSKRMTKAMELGAREYLFKADTPFPRLVGIIQKHLGETADVAAQARTA